MDEIEGCEMAKSKSFEMLCLMAPVPSEAKPIWLSKIYIFLAQWIIQSASFSCGVVEVEHLFQREPSFFLSKCIYLFSVLH